ncbi:MAG TPA: N-6 DNA methylase [Anaerolineaceae bacterium]|nr:N-6 DNA methylase [Anaerolineaceae bacterium]HPN53743.1 N-6 DNA methylase [Anaerolineaceae bacterium]
MSSQAQINPLGYASIELRKDSGAHYTPSILSDFVASHIAAQIDLSYSTTIKILDPAVGDGELIISLLKEVRNIWKGKNIEVHGFDTDQNALRIASKRMQEEFPDTPVFFSNEDFLDYAIQCGRNDLFSQKIEKFDIVIANPPYVRTQILGAKNAQRIANIFNLSGRIDLYHAFLLGISMVLKPGGLAGVITSNRFMTTKSGGCVRSAIINEFTIIHVWDLGDTQFFEAAVLPSVLLLKRKNGNETYRVPGFTSIYSTTTRVEDCVVANVLDAVNCPGIIKTESGQFFEIKVGLLDHGQSNDGVWRVSTVNSDNNLSMVRANTYCTFGDIGKIRVGIKTTADKVFIRSDWSTLPKDEQPELLFPLITHHVARRYRMDESSTPLFVLYPHIFINGKRTTVDLKDYPNTSNYLEKNRVTLEARDYVISSGRKWFEIWVPQDPNAWSKPKLIFRDISEEPTFWIDLNGGIVNGDCYWLVSDTPDHDELLWLALAIGNSSFIEWFYDQSFNNKLYSGRRRFMTQYVEKFPLPQPDTELGKEIIRLAKTAYSKALSKELGIIEKELDILIWKSFGLSNEEVSR